MERHHSQLVEAAKELVALNTLPDVKVRLNMHQMDAHNKLAKALEASPEGERGDVAAGWQPIESAPKDGTQILVLVDYDGKLVVRAAEWVDHLDEWTDIDDEDFLPAIKWQPYPNPPAAQPDENVCECGAVGDEECPRKPGMCAQPTQPVPPSEGEVAAGPFDRLFTAACDVLEEVEFDSTHRQSIKAMDELTDAVQEASPHIANPTPEGPKPTGTIFELDLYAREGLARLADRYESATETVTIPRRQVINLIRDISDELKVRIDNCMKQYAVPEGHVAVYLPVEVADRMAKRHGAQPRPNVEDSRVLMLACRVALFGPCGVCGNTGVVRLAKRWEDDPAQMRCSSCGRTTTPESPNGEGA